MSEKLSIFQLIDRRPIDESKHDSDENMKLDFPVWHGLKNPFYVVKDGKRLNFQYIQGANTLSMEQQQAQGLKIDIQTDLVGFDSGKDIIVDGEYNPLLLEFLKIHPENVRSEYHNPKIHRRIFTEFIQSEVTAKETAVAAVEDEAIEICLTLKNDVPQLRAIAALFGVSVLQSIGDIYLDVRKIAKAMPERFVSSVANAKNSHKADVLKAIQYKILVKTTKGFAFSGDSSPFFDAKNVAEKDAVDALANYLLTEDASEIYKEMILKIKEEETKLSQAK